MGGNRLIQLVFSPNEKVICFALMLYLFICIPLFIAVSAMVARVVASMRANGCSHTVTLYFESFF